MFLCLYTGFSCAAGQRQSKKRPKQTTLLHFSQKNKAVSYTALHSFKARFIVFFVAFYTVEVGNHQVTVSGGRPLTRCIINKVSLPVPNSDVPLPGLPLDPVELNDDSGKGLFRVSADMFSTCSFHLPFIRPTRSRHVRSLVVFCSNVETCSFHIALLPSRSAASPVSLVSLMADSWPFYLVMAGRRAMKPTDQ